MKESMKNAGVKQGDMSPKVSDYQAPMASYSQRNANMTTEYVERQDKIQTKQGNDISKQAYKGRYK